MLFSRSYFPFFHNKVVALSSKHKLYQSSIKITCYPYSTNVSHTNHTSLEDPGQKGNKKDDSGDSGDAITASGQTPSTPNDLSTRITYRQYVLPSVPHPGAVNTEANQSSIHANACHVHRFVSDWFLLGAKTVHHLQPRLSHRRLSHLL